MLLDRLAREIKVFDFVFNETVIVKKCCATLGSFRRCRHVFSFHLLLLGWTML